MNMSRNRLYRLAVTAAVFLLLGAGPGLAQSGPVPCSAFARNNVGGWRVLAPVMLDLNGQLLAPTVGTVFAAGSTRHGIEVRDVLDQQCGNR